MEQVERLLAEAKRARENAYAPYSRFKVGAALLGKSGRVYRGCNVENASYGATICAERAAIVQAVSQGEREFDAIAVVADMPEPVPPCGLCRQVLAEFSPQMQVIMGNLAGQVRITSVEQLYPGAFTQSALLEPDAKQRG
jgi:cytidine deaminase